MSNVINTIKSIFSNNEPTPAILARIKFNTYKTAEMRADIIGISAAIKYEKYLLKKFNKQFPSKDVEKHASHSSIKNKLRWKARAKYIAYGLLRGKAYNVIESTQRDKEWYSSWEFRHLVDLVSKECIEACYTTTERQYWSNVDNIKKLLGENSNET